MKTLLTLLLATLCAATGYGQTIKTLGFNTTNGRVHYTNTNATLTFVSPTNAGVVNSYTPVRFAIGDDPTQALEIVITDEGLDTGYDAVVGSIGSGGGVFSIKYGVGNNAWAAPLLINAPTQNYFGGLFLTNTNVTNFRTAIGLGSSDSVQFDEVFSQSFEATAGGTNYIRFNSESISFGTPSLAAATRTNLGLGATNDVVFNSISFSGGGTSRLTNDSFYFGTNLIFSIEDASFAIPIAFAGSNTAATTRTNLGLGGGITATNTFVSYNGTNYTTNSVSISNGVITGWTQ